MTIFPSNLRAIAHALGGEVSGSQVLAPGPGHGPRDRSLSVRLSATAPDGFIAFGHAGDDWRACRDYVRERLGLDRTAWKAERSDRSRPAPKRLPSINSDDDAKRTADVAALWRASVNSRGTPVELYLNSRGLELDDDIAGEVLRWHPGIGAMLALFRNIASGRPQAVGRTFLDGEARKIERKFLGPVGGAAIMLDPSDAVLGGLHVGEGVETCLAARQLGLRPCWALGSKGAIGAFPVLSGIEALTILAESDAERETQGCAARWHDARREVFINRPIGGKDLNDAIRGAA
jgi:putative DNA primase/helicase